MTPAPRCEMLSTDFLEAHRLSSAQIAAKARGQELRPGAGALVLLQHNALGPELARAALNALREGIPWQQQRIRIAGQLRLEPRLSCWIGDAGATYRYSRTTFTPQPWSDCLLDIRRRLEILCGHSFNSVLCNAYRDGQDNMGWHADDEAELGPEPIIASYSLGMSRHFQMRPKSGPRARRPWSVELDHDDLLIMSGPTQQRWQHRIPRQPGVTGWRINLTFRQIHGPLPPASASKCHAGPDCRD